MFYLNELKARSHVKNITLIMQLNTLGIILSRTSNISTIFFIIKSNLYLTQLNSFRMSKYYLPGQKT